MQWFFHDLIINFLIWRNHEHMSQCTGIKVITSYERIASCAARWKYRFCKINLKTQFVEKVNSIWHDIIIFIIIAMYTNTLI